MKRFVVVIGMVLALGGCQTAMTYPPNYKVVNGFEVFEKPGSVMTVGNLGQAVGSFYGVAKAQTMEEHQAAAQAYLGPNCTITGGRLLAQPQYVFDYKC